VENEIILKKAHKTAELDMAELDSTNEEKVDFTKKKMAIVKSKIAKAPTDGSFKATAFTIGSLIINGLFVASSYTTLIWIKDIREYQYLVWGIAISTPIYMCLVFWFVAMFHKKYYIGERIDKLTGSSEPPKDAEIA